MVAATVRPSMKIMAWCSRTAVSRERRTGEHAWQSVQNWNAEQSSYIEKFGTPSHQGYQA
ncbi:MAG: hypothetical protein ACLT4C_09130 [Butyricicoccus sp.]